MHQLPLNDRDQRACSPRASIRVEGIILAAGLSTRMTYCKLEAEIEGVSVIQRVLQAALNSELNGVVLVTGPAELSCVEVSGDDSTLSKLEKVANLNPERGMASSMRKGLEALKSDTAGAMVLLADQPGISPAIINKLLEIFRAHPDKIVVPFVLGRRTTPVIFPAALFPELNSITGDVGGREVLVRHAEKITAAELGNLYDDTDVDTPEDLDKIRQTFAMKTRPTE